MVEITVEVPDSVPMTVMDIAELPGGWDNAVAPDSTKDIGTKWAASNASVVLSVPSAVVTTERNYLINTVHPYFAEIKFEAPKAFIFDPRLKPAPPPAPGPIPFTP